MYRTLKVGKLCSKIFLKEKSYSSLKYKLNMMMNDNNTISEFSKRFGYPDQHHTHASSSFQSRQQCPANNKISLRSKILVCDTTLAASRDASGASLLGRRASDSCEYLNGRVHFRSRPSGERSSSRSCDGKRAPAARCLEHPRAARRRRLSHSIPSAQSPPETSRIFLIVPPLLQ
jgi:hypothetical protein